MAGTLNRIALIVTGLVVVAANTMSGTDHSSCVISRCRKHGPDIRFPFRLKGHQAEHCAYPHPAFHLSCSQTNDTLMELQFQMLKTTLPFSVELFVERIDYYDQRVSLSTGAQDGPCPAQVGLERLPEQLPELHISASPFYINYPYNISFFSCSSKKDFDYLYSIPCLSSSSYRVYAIQSDAPAIASLTSCTKMFEVPPNLALLLQPSYYRFQFDWSKQNCKYCEANDKYCLLKNSSKTNDDDDDVECLDKASHPVENPVKKLKVAGMVLGPFLAVLIAIGVYQVHRSTTRKREDEQKIEQFLEDYRALKPTRYSYADIKKVSENFSEKLGEGGYGTVYKGKLSNEVFVAVKVLNNTSGDGEEFINEVGTIGKIHHVNVVRLAGYCADGFRRVLVYEFLPNNSLEKFISSSENKKENVLGWEKLEQIALGIAKGIDYLHQGCDQTILHFDIKPHNILLDHNYNPKISDFGLAKLCSKEQSAVSMTAARGTIGYIAPEVFSRNFGKVSSKSDVYSFGMLLLEMVGGRNKIIDAADEDESLVYFPEWMYKKLDKGEEITIQIDESEDDKKIARKLAIVGLWCIQWCPVDRPSMKSVIQMLEADGTPPMPQNPFGSKINTKNKTAMGGSFFSSQLESISELE